MKRWPWVIVVCLLIGAVLNIGVSWGCALFTSFDMSPDDYGIAGNGWPDAPPDGWPAPDFFVRLKGVGVSGVYASHDLGRLAESRRTDPTITMHGMSVRAFGLPWRSLGVSLQFTQNMRVFTEVSAGPIRDGLRPPHWLERPGMGDRRIPLRPIWPGFLVDTLLYALCACGVCRGCAVMRRASRRRRGFCIACAYPVAGLPKCPECGAATYP